MLGGGKEAEEAEATASEGGLEWIVLLGSEWLQVGSWGEGDVGWSTVSDGWWVQTDSEWRDRLTSGLSVWTWNILAFGGRRVQ